MAHVDSIEAQPATQVAKRVEEERLVEQPPLNQEPQEQLTPESPPSSLVKVEAVSKKF